MPLTYTPIYLTSRYVLLFFPPFLHPLTIPSLSSKHFNHFVIHSLSVLYKLSISCYLCVLFLYKSFFLCLSSPSAPFFPKTLFCPSLPLTFPPSLYSQLPSWLSSSPGQITVKHCLSASIPESFSSLLRFIWGDREQGSGGERVREQREKAVLSCNYGFQGLQWLTCTAHCTD